MRDTRSLHGRLDCGVFKLAEGQLCPKAAAADGRQVEDCTQAQRDFEKFDSLDVRACCPADIAKKYAMSDDQIRVRRLLIEILLEIS